MLNQNIKSQRQCALAFVNDTKITSPGVAIWPWEEIDIQRSVMKREKS